MKVAEIQGLVKQAEGTSNSKVSMCSSSIMHNYVKIFQSIAVDLTRVSFICHQLKTVTLAMRRSSAGEYVVRLLRVSCHLPNLRMFRAMVCPTGNPESWQGVVDVLTGNFVNLMTAIQELLKDMKSAAVRSRRTLVIFRCSR